MITNFEVLQDFSLFAKIMTPHLKALTHICLETEAQGLVTIFMVTFRGQITIDVRKGVLGGLTPPLRLKIWADPPLGKFSSR